MSKMPTPDASLKEFFKDNEIFASLFNDFLFEHKQVVLPSELKAEDTAFTETVQVGEENEKVSKYRDIIRSTSIGTMVILAVENQDKIHYAMPVRKMLYDALSYADKINVSGKEQDKTKWTVDERLSGVKKGTKIAPVITVIFYTGEKEWDGPRTIHELLDIDERVKPFVPDYPLLLVDLAHDKSLSFTNAELESLRCVLRDIYNKVEDDKTYDTSIMALAGILANSKELYHSMNELSKERKCIGVCEALKLRDKEIKSELNALIQWLIANDRIDDLLRSTSDTEYQDQLMQEYQNEKAAIEQNSFRNNRRRL